MAQCRACNSSNLVKVLDLGSTPLANSLLANDQLNETEYTVPLVVSFCPGCALLQITDVVPPEKMFRNYAYFSSFSDTMLMHAKALALNLIEIRQLNEKSFVLEIASNDGYLLKNYNEKNIPTLGIEPALNVAATAKERGINTISEFFGKALANKLVKQYGQSDIIHAHNVLAHVPEINDILQGIRIMLKDNGIAVIEVPYALEMIDRIEFDTIYHEHVFYFSLTAINNLCRQNDLILQDVERVKIHGGSLRLYISKSGQSSPNVEALLKYEQERQFDNEYGYQNFADRVRNLKKELVTLLTELKAQGKKIAAYGAAAKGSTLLNFFNIGRETLDFVVDRSTAKQGLFMPGVKLPIYHPDQLLKDKPDYVLLLTWNFADEIFKQQIEYLRLGGKFIVPVPSPKIVSLESIEATAVEPEPASLSFSSQK